MKSVVVSLGSLALLWSAIAIAETRVVMKTNMGEIEIALDEEKAPVTVDNFLKYVDDGSFKDTIFHRVIAGFMIQGGGHYLDLSEAECKGVIRNEADNGLANLRGTIAMARTNEIDSASRQFFINVTDNHFLDHTSESCTREDDARSATARAQGRYRPQTCKSFGYAVFGRVVSGMDVVELIELSETGALGPYDDVPTTPVVILSVNRVGTESAE